MTAILGISAFYHDSAAALVLNGDIIAAAQEERFTRIKHDASFPKKAINFVLKEANISLDHIDYVVFYEKPFLKFERLLETYVDNAPRGFSSFRKAMPIWLREKLFQKSVLTNELKRFDKNFNPKKLLFSEHHYSHAASAFFPSPFDNSLILTIDGVGEWATTTVSIGKNNNIKIIKEINFPNSIGLLYSAFTYYLGFKVNSGEYKVMGLAPYGKPKFVEIIKDNLIDIKNDGSFCLNQSFFNYTTGLTMTNQKFSKLFGQKVRKSENEKLTQFHMDIAASIQKVIEDIIIKMTSSLAAEHNIPNLCLAGGVALNCVANSKILKTGHFKNIWIQPAAGDAGGSLGAALSVWYQFLKKPRNINQKDSMKGSLLGPSFTQDSIKESLLTSGAKFQILDSKSTIKKTVEALEEGKAIGWFQNKMEFGPRALGARSIIADPRSEKMQKNLNLKVKYRESFRPFAPSILRHELSDWFELDQDSSYMLLVAKVKAKHCNQMTEEEENLFGIDKLNIKRSIIPAVTHVDYSARVQTVEKEINPKYYELINEFNKKTGCPILVNTSFNVRGEPIVCTPEDAFKCFMGTDLDVLVVENFFLIKSDQDKMLRQDYKNKYALD
ncbi:MAG: Decarbamoylnovobiocin carbamoyltransferase [Alphaproteobacteria bacterium MarineAlpha5_Bin8]|nr:MAG: Decarbamoylnovobiocin carbamoyltransferase [Alphaproteobacteria bacterium MarineAlpha5_Bin8]PPR46083.1 MAG: Decarbamoylnovobiocin carbamoyltransferase [Alphaproteobacteria bacterium MarineAlpha5_Bin7]